MATAERQSRGGPARVVVLGAGITGLSAAYELERLARHERRAVEIVVLEASSRVGGKILTERREGAVIEGGPDSFVTAKPHALELIQELGLSSELVGTNAERKTVYLHRAGGLVALPDGVGVVPRRLWPFVRSPLFSWKGKARMALEAFIPAQPDAPDESLASFARRRLGREALERLVGPMLAGIYAGDPEQLSVQSTFPQLREMELAGGLLRSVWKRGSARAQPGSRLPIFMTLAGGLSRLVETLALKLPARTVRTGAAVRALSRRGGQWQLRLSTEDTLSADAVVCALPAPALAEAVADLDFELACVLKEIPFASTATVSMLFDEAALGRSLDGYGLLVDRSQNKATVGMTFSSVKFPGRAPQGQELLRSFLGGAGREACVQEDDADIARLARAELKDLLGLKEAHPRITRVFRWLKANPQYTVGHALRLKRIESCLQGHPGLVLAGCSYQGVGLPDCIRSGREAARRALRATGSRVAAGIC